ncbi:MAG: hypothetical protein HKN12_11070, partial [Gemmatimonadetes bacterium]|nr:hypothetical protein [Gemmatimonadota bacterium]
MPSSSFLRSVALACVPVLLLPVLLTPRPVAAQAVPGPDPLAFEWQFEAPDARARAMGGAYTAIAEGATAVWWNPATLPGSGRLYQSPFSRFEPVPEDTFGSALYTLAGNVGGRTWGGGLALERYSRQGINPATGGQEPPTEESLLTLGGGVDVLQLLWGGSDRYRWSVGSNFKYFHVKWGNRADGTKWDADLST